MLLDRAKSWILSRLDCPTASEQEIECYFEELAFQKMLHLEVSAFLNPELDPVIFHAQTHNLLKDDAGNLVPIDVLIGPPSPRLRSCLGITPLAAR